MVGSKREKTKKTQAEKNVRSVSGSKNTTKNQKRTTRVGKVEDPRRSAESSTKRDGSPRLGGSFQDPQSGNLEEGRR